MPQLLIVDRQDDHEWGKVPVGSVKRGYARKRASYPISILVGTFVSVSLAVVTIAPPAWAVSAAESQELSVVITSPAAGSLVAGGVEIVAESSEAVEWVTFSVSTDLGATWTELAHDTTGADGRSAWWQSDPHSGPAILRATAGEGGSVVSDEVSVIADNSPPAVTVRSTRKAFSPNDDGRKDSTVLEATSGEPTMLTLTVVDRDGRVRRSWSSPEPTTTLTVRWRGRGDGETLRDARYTVRAEGVDAVGLEARASTRVLLDTRAPRFRSLRIGPKLFSVSGTLRAEYRLRDRSRDFKVRLQIADRFGSVGRTKRQSQADGTIRYSTRYGNGDPLYPGRYSARLRVRDAAGNVKVSRKVAWRMHRSVQAKVFERLNNVGRRVALTFDDCNHSEAWDRILRTLSTFRVKATFFCSGQQVSEDRAVARRTVEQGHAIGAHGWDHALLTGRSRSETEWRIRSDARLWWDLARTTTAPLYRPAYGGFDASVLAAAGATGHGRVVMWDVDSLDYATTSPQAVSDRVLRETRPGSIVLLHVLDQTASALPAILRGLSDRGLNPVHLPRLFRSAGYR